MDNGSDWRVIEAADEEPEPRAKGSAASDEKLRGG